MLIRRTPLLLLGALTPVVAACGTDAGGSSENTVTVSARDDGCEVARTELPTGPVTFTVTNDGSQVTEVYVYGQDETTFSRIISEVENIGPGTSRDLETELSAGTYEVACKPGQTGPGIRTRITVAGENPPGSATDVNDSGEKHGDQSYDRELELVTDGTTLSGLAGDAQAGEAIEFKLTNQGTAPRTLELKNPAGAVAAEIDVQPGSTGETVVELADAGTWQVILEGHGMDDIIQQLTVR